MDLLKIPRSVC